MWRTPPTTRQAKEGQANSPPRFVETQYVGRLPENQPTGTGVLTVRAVDNENDQITYQLSGEDGRFKINSVTGEITSNVNIDREKLPGSNLLEFKAIAYDAKGAGYDYRVDVPVRVQIEDVNDNTPVFINTPYSISVKENTLGTTGFAVKATDADQGQNALIKYSITGGNEANMFKIGAYEGTISVFPDSGVLDYEKYKSFNLTVSASDLGGVNGSRTAVTSVFIRVEDVDDLPAVFSPDYYTAKVAESSTKGFYVTTVTARDGDLSLNKPVSYFIDQVTNPGEAFVIINTTGVITVNKPLDRETVAFYNLRVGAISTIHKAVFATVQITITDINDNAPKFVNLPYSGTVPENSPTGLTVLRVTAQDADSGDNAKFTYSLTGAAGKFVVSSEGYVVVSGNIDRETQDTYEFKVNAKESTTSEQFSTATDIKINVTDVNDNNPQCSQNAYSATVQENMPNGTKVMQVSVSDADLGPNADVRFSFIPDSSGLDKLFTIDPVSGDIKTLATFDREERVSYGLGIRVIDQPSGQQGRIGECSVQVSIGDVNDNSPEFKNLPNNTHVSEKATTNTPVYTVKATDIDDGLNAAVSYVIMAGNDGNVFTMEASSGLVKTSSSLDRETTPVYTLVVRATDGGGKEVTSSLTVILDDVNDNAPVFSRPEGYTFEVQEGGVGLSVGTVQATDRDSGINAATLYSLKSVADYSKFIIDSKTGVIKTSFSLDRETQDQLNIRVIARDTGSPQLSAEVGIIVNVTDINDHRPAFSQRQYSVTVQEKRASHVILTLTATDSDRGINSALHYMIDSGNFGNSFTLDALTGSLSTTGPLDREVRAEYTLLVFVSDLQGNASLGIPLRDSAVVNVFIEDMNDNSPVFPQSQYSLTIPEDTAPGTGIIQVQARDIDSGISQNLHYSIVSGNSLGRFFIDSSSARVYVKSPLDRDPPRNEGAYTLEILVEDAGNNSLNSTTKVTITISDVNDSPPEFSQAMYSVRIPENITLGTVVLQPSCVDRDLGTNGQISYHISSGNSETPPRFSVNPSSGALSVSTEFDFDTGRKSYSLVLTATDKGEPALSGNATVVIDLENVNDNTPEFTRKAYLFNVREGSYIDNEKIVGRVSAIDRDKDAENSAYGRIQYSFLNQSSYYRSHYWQMDSLESGRNIRDLVTGNTDARVVGGASVVQDSQLGNVIAVSGSEQYIRVGDFENDCVSNPSLCPDGLSVAFWLKFNSGRYIISSGGQSQFAAGFAFYYTKETNKYTLLLATLNRKWEIMLASIPQTWYYVTFTWNSQSGLRYFENGRYLNFVPSSTSVTRMSDAFTVLTVGKPNNIDQLDYFGNLSISDLIIWNTMLTIEEVMHSYMISRHITKEPMATAPQYIDTFAIDPMTGDIRAVGLLDRETKLNYTLDVKATDVDPVDPRWSAAVVYVEVLDSNDNAPVFKKQSYVVEMVEHSPTTFTVVKVEATDRDVGSNGRISYSIVSGNVDGAFVIDSSSGVIKPAQDIDREKIQRYLLGVQAQDGGSPTLQATVQVTINIQDVNDNTPVLTSSTYTASVPENQPPGQSVLKISVFDPDHAGNGQVAFTVNNNKFTVNDTSGVLYTTHVLDRETKASYQLTITATDKGSPARSSSVNVRVNVIDENDNIPQFSQALYTAGIVENMTVGSHVIKVSAVDPDEGSNGDILYSLQTDYDIFAINQTSGVIRVVALVDREAHPAGYSLLVVARDHGYPTPNAATARVNITISDINDNAPRFLKFTYSGSVREDRTVGTEVVQVQATDDDDGLAGEIVFAITGGDPEGLFSILNTSGKITVARSLDREMKATYELTVTATDRAGDPKSTSVEVDITITDANDNKPVFTNIPATILLSESTIPGTPVITVVATDQDIGVNGQVRYVGDSPKGKFAVNAITGVVSTVGELDYEDVQRYTVYIVAIDQGEPQLNSTTLHLNISLVDANDNNPTFTKAAYTAHVSEEATAGTNVIMVNATERDSGKDSKITYNISAGDPLDHFAINHLTGQISVRKALDRETTSLYTLLVSARDGGTPPRFGQATVTIHVDDVNDRAPVFRFHNYQKEIPEDTAVGTSILTVEAIDEDTPSNTKLTYSILSGNEDGNLQISSALSDSKYMGIIKVAKPLDRESSPLYSLNISVSDGVHEGYTVAQILLRDVNDCDPEFNYSLLYSAHVSENSLGGQLVLKVTATDRDLGTNAQLTYSMAGDDNRFTIGPSSGEIRTSSLRLDREAKPVYVLHVTATDSGGRRGHANVTVIILDQNDNPPVFTPASYNATFTEGSSTRGVLIATVKATDSDDGANGDVDYSIVDGNVGDVFTINNATGEIRSSKPLDREAIGVVEDSEGKGVYRLTIRGSDHGNPPLHGTALVRVLLNDINDNPPVFPPNGYSVMISEGAKANQDVIAAIAIDKDAGESKRLTYELISGNTGGDFTLDPNTGMIKTARNLERQQTFSYNLTIGAADHGLPSFSATTRVSIVVGDLNDNNPVFNPTNYSTTVFENSPVGTSLLDVTATDADSGQNAYVTYSVTAGDSHGLFRAVTKSNHGTIEVAGNLDREVNDFYNLTITATDGGVPISRTAIAIALVRILDRNDNVPKFSHARYTGSIQENSGPGVPVQMASSIMATDRDIESNADVRYRLNGSDSIQFAVNPRTGVITTRVSPPPSLDHERTTNYTFHVIAADQAGTGHESLAEVVIHVLDANDNTPRFIPSSIQSTISEAASIGQSVARVTANDPDSGLNGRIFFSINSGSEGKFEIGRSDGVVRVSGSLDREAKAVYVLNVSAIDGSYSPREGYGTVTVTLQDVNDNTPKFTKPAFNVDVSEGVAVGSVIVNATATDPDQGSNAAITYSMSYPGFAINSNTGSVTITRPLDRETKQAYSFTVHARDGGGLESNVAVNVEIGDENDNSPQFPTVQYQTDVIDRTPVGTIVLAVNAEDRDVGNNGHVTYAIRDSRDPGLFTIDANNGLITVNKIISRLQLGQSGFLSNNGSFVFKVEARDHGTSPRATNVTVVINIVDSGDDSPVFNTSSYVVKIDEDRPIGSSVVMVEVVKKRAGTIIMYSIGSSQNVFSIDNLTGLVTTAAKLDRESRDDYVITVQATDNGQTPRVGYTSVVIHVTDINDNAPKFQFPAPYKMTVNEDAALGTGVGRVKAIDGDQGLNGMFEYAITHANIGPGLKMIAVNTACATPLGLVSGDIKASDMTATSTYTVPNEDYSPTQGRLNNQPFNKAGVFYKGAWCAASNSDQQYLQIDLGGMRKVTRVTTQGRPGSSDYVGSYSLSFSQDGSSYTQHRTVLTGNSDGDTLRENRILPASHARYVRIQPTSWNGRICLRVELYGCESTGKDEVILPFIIVPDTGNINTSSKLDREQQSLYTLVVQAKDKGSPSLESNTTIEISLIDTNDNVPKFSSPVYYASAPENAYGGYQVIRVSATDADEGTNAQLAYNIVSGGDGKFIIEGTSGIVRPSGRLDYESMVQKHYVLNLSVTDHGVTQFTSFALLNISVTDFNDNQPQFNQSEYSATVLENMPVGTKVTMVTARDEDSGINSQIMYSLTGGDGVFSIEPSTGQIRLQKAINREAKENYHVTITASDRGTPVLSSDAKVHVHVLDVNDNPPVFTSRVYERTMSEGVAVGTIAYSVQAVDADIGSNGRMMYEITAGNDQGLFTLDPVLGSIRVSRPLDRETNKTITLTVLAKDQGIPQLSDQASVVIYLTDVNDNAPVIRPRNMSAAVPENAAAGEFVVQVNATDADVERNGHVTYTIMHGALGMFTINETTGVIRTQGVLNRESKDFYTLIVMARDQGAVPYMDFGTIDVHVIDKNDNTPIFLTTFGPFSVVENMPVGTTVGEVSASDNDIGTNAAISYTISGGDDSRDFRIHDKTGVIYTAKQLNRERMSQYLLTITAANLDTSPALSSGVVVRVNVLDVNDDIPAFKSSSYNMSISEASPPGTSVVKVTAIDKDEGTNSRVLYRIRHDASSANSDVFSINAETGVLSTQVFIDEYEYRAFTVIVEAKDMGSPTALSSTVPVYVTIVDVNDNQPVFANKLYSTSISESALNGSSVIQVAATDADTGINSRLTYRIISGDEQGHFAINASTGLISVNSALDRESIDSFRLTVGAFNDEALAFNNTSRREQRNVDASGHFYDTTTIQISLEDINDNRPVFVRPLFVGGIPEGAELNTYIMRITATDADAANFSSVSYRISSGNEGGFFTLESSTGVITSASLFQGKKGQRFTIKVVAYDNNGLKPTNEALVPADVRVYVLLDEQRITLKAEVDPSLIEENKEEFLSVLRNITEAEVTIQQIFKVLTVNNEGERTVNSEVVFHAVKDTNQQILTSDQVLRTISKYSAQLETLYAKWKIKAVKVPANDSGSSQALSNAELALIILGAVIGLALLIGLCFAIKTRCTYKKEEMYNEPPTSRSKRSARAGSWSYYDDAITNERGGVAAVRMHPDRDSSFNSGAFANSGYLLSKKRLSQNVDDKIWSEGDFYLSQDSKMDSYLNDDGESEHGADGSDVSQPSTSRSPKHVALTTDGPITRV
ncbi:cadherin-23-like isoform X2 [Nematostella vectensis]|uniref:cadherin-23-like isoform X2 n=1 Tax=Nematostella vectensis TaxID=45351 RepID=UPI002076E59F|nr:cadherin-23-like isoform X2 [Nematostella vectensis]